MSTAHTDPAGPATAIGKAVSKVEDFYIKHDRTIMLYSSVSLMTTGASAVVFNMMGLPSYLTLFVQVVFNISWFAAKFSNKLAGRK